MQNNSAELLTIGNEVLAGNVLDTNSHWLCQQLAALGAQVRRVTVLPDEPEQIADALLAAIGRGPRLLLTCGGLGPTRDDLTVAAIGRALGLAVEENPVAYAMIRDFYAELHRRGAVTTGEMLPARAKMAQMPAGAEPLLNAAGAAPGVLLRRGATTIVCMPGVPAEMKDIFSNSLAPRLPALFGSQSYGERTVKTDAWDESILAPAVDAVAARHPDVYVKSRAQVYGGGVEDFVTLAARGADEAEVGARLDAAERDLRAALREIGVATS
jgi:molybdenum cofactor synthesis domain-containing protein